MTRINASVVIKGIQFHVEVDHRSSETASKQVLDVLERLKKELVK